MRGQNYSTVGGRSRGAKKERPGASFPVQHSVHIECGAEKMSRAPFPLQHSLHIKYVAQRPRGGASRVRAPFPLLYSLYIKYVAQGPRGEQDEAARPIPCATQLLHQISGTRQRQNFIQSGYVPSESKSIDFGVLRVYFLRFLFLKKLSAHTRQNRFDSRRKSRICSVLRPRLATTPGQKC